MTKGRLIASLLISFILIVPQATNAAPTIQPVVAKPSVAIIDTGFDTSIPLMKNRISQEVCILDWNTCPNGKNFMEGTGSSVIPAKFINLNGLEHGTQMASVLLSNNADIQVVLVRIVGNSINGNRQIVSEASYVNALNWVYSNKDRFNIQAVSISSGHHNLLPTADYCPKTTNTQTQIKNLLDSGIPTFVAAGNGRDYKRIDWPACINEAVAIGASTDYDEIPIWSNVDVLKTDFYALGTWDTVLPGNAIKTAVGTSISTQIAAAQWMIIRKNKPNLSFQEIYNLMLSTSKTIPNPIKLNGKLIDLKMALK